MIFTKIAFRAVKGYDGLYNTNRGADLFLYYRIYKKFLYGIHYIKNLEATVYSDPPDNFLELLKQGRSWISKTSGYENICIKIQAGIIFLTNFLFYSGLFIFPLLPINVLKLLMDILFNYKIKQFYGFKLSLLKTIVYSCLYPF